MDLITWSPTDKNGAIILSQENMHLSVPSNSGAVRATHFKTSGKWYWENKITWATWNKTVVGVGNKSSSIESNSIINNGYAIRADGQKGSKNVMLSYTSSIATNSTIGIALDIDNKTIEFFINGVSKGIAFTDIDDLGEYYPMGGKHVDGSGTVLVNFGETEFQYPIPEGFKPFATLPKIRHLIKSSNKIQILSNGVWNDTGIVGTPTALDFETYGIDSIVAITEEQWSQLQKPIEVLTWTDDEKAMSAKIAYDKKEFTVPKLELTVPEYKPIDLIEGDIEIIALGEGEEVPKLHIEGFRDLRPFCESPNPKLLINTEQENSPMVNTSAIPQRQLVISKGDIELRMLNRVQSFTITSTESTNGKVRIVASADSGLTWKTFDTTLGEFKNIDIENLDEVEKEGMTIAEFNSVGLNWNGLIREARIKFGYYLEIENMEDVANVDKLEVSMEVLGSWEGTLHEIDYNYEYDNEKIYIDLYRDGSYKMNYN